MDSIEFRGSNLRINRLGMGSWAIGGPCIDNGAPMGWGDVDDEQSIRAIRRGIELGVSYIDTANIYGAGHSEEVVGIAVKGIRDRVVISTKFGILCDPERRCTTGIIRDARDVRESCEASLRRLGTDYIDIFLFHLGSCEEALALEVRDVLEDLICEGKIRSFGWSTEVTSCAEVFAESPGCSAIMHIENLFEDYAGMIELCERRELISICRSPLCMGLLTGKYGLGTRFENNDLRGKNAPAWMNYFVNGQPNPVLLRRLNAVREILTFGGRTLAQGCLAWLWARSPTCVPVPGFRNEAQVEENVRAMEYGPLTTDQMEEISRILHCME